MLEADALVFVTPVFTAGMSGLAKSFLDVLDKDGVTDLPVLLAATGGTARHSLAIDHALRPVSRTCAPPSFRPVSSRRDRRLGERGGLRRAGRTHPPGRGRPAWAIRASRRTPQQETLAAPTDFASLLGGLGH